MIINPFPPSLYIERVLHIRAVFWAHKSEKGHFIEMAITRPLFVKNEPCMACFFSKWVNFMIKSKKYINNSYKMSIICGMWRKKKTLLWLIFSFIADKPSGFPVWVFYKKIMYIKLRSFSFFSHWKTIISK